MGKLDKGIDENLLIIINILINRDGYSFEDARLFVQETLEDVLDMIQNGDCDEAEEYFCDNLTLEPDYLYNIIS